jgi:hypothetical protein
MVAVLSLGRMKMNVYLLPYHRANLDTNFARQVKLPYFYGKCMDHLLVCVLNQLNPIHAHI